MVFRKIGNNDIARVLDEIARLLELQHADPHRVRAYRNGAKAVRLHEGAIADLVRSGDGEALEALPAIGKSLARLIGEYVRTGKSQLLQRLKGAVAPEDIFEQVPGIGHDLAVRIVRDLDIRSLEELEQAAHDGRLAKVEGFGKRRVEAIRMSLAGWLSGYARRRMARLATAEEEVGQPGVDRILAVDREYRQKAAAGTLRKIAPKRFNPSNQAWLPVLHTEQDDWSFTALFSNTARAHELGRTDDWVVIYWDRDGDEGQCTVVTETSGPLEGKRVVRGREGECRAYYLK